MLEITPELLEASLSEALEIMAFITGMRAQQPESPQGPLIATRIDYTGVLTGRMELVCPRRLGAILVANLLGCDPDSPEANDRAPDALGELGNITCGAVLKRTNATELGLIEMTVPAQQPFETEKWPELISSGALIFEAESCLIALACTGEPKSK